MKSIEVDVAIIGMGTAGLAALAAARSHTENFVIIDPGPLGTTCARTGCMPSKLLIAAANAMHGAATADTFGISVSHVAADGPAVMKRVRKLRDRFVASVRESIDSLPEEKVIRERAELTGPNSVVAGDYEITARAIIVATGSSPTRLPMFDHLDADLLLTTEDVFDLPDLPERLAVVGGGAIGLELGQAFSRLGVEVTLFEANDRLAGAQDPEIATQVNQHFTGEIDTWLNCDIHGADPTGDGRAVIRFSDENGQAHQKTVNRILVAAGRRPNLDFAPQAANLEVDLNGVPEFDPLTMRCGTSAIFLAGDVDQHRPILHEAADDGRTAGDNAGRYPAIRAVPRRTSLTITFTEPQLVQIGTDWQDLPAGEFAVGEIDFSRQGRSLVIAKNVGLGRLYGHCQTGKLLGGELFGPHAEHLAHLIAWCISLDLTVKEVLALPVYHPVIEEGLRTAIKDLADKLQQGPPLNLDCMDCGPGV